MDKHYHLQLKTRPNQARQWSDDEVVDRWWRLYPKRGQEAFPEAIRQAWLADPEFLATLRGRHTIIMGEKHLRATLIAYADYYNSDRPHRSLKF